MKTIPSFKKEQVLWNQGLKAVVGIDEVGRGAFAGPLVAAAVILPKNFNIEGINDSKLLNPLKRGILSKYILKTALTYTISEVSVEYINEYGIGKANDKAFLDCINKLNHFDHVLVDGYKLKNFDNNKQTGIIHGDSISISIAAASIIAKVHRDNLMITLHDKYPEYNFFQNKGYGTKQHRNALKKYGISKIHRTSFNLKKFL